MNLEYMKRRPEVPGGTIDPTPRTANTTRSALPEYAETASTTTDRAMQTYGGMAYSTDSDIERHWRDTRLLRTGPVPEEMVLSFIGQRVLGLPRSY